MRGPPSFYEAGADWASRFFWLLWRLAILTLVLYLLWRVQHVVALLLVSGAFAYILSPIVDYLCRWRPPKITPFFWRGLVTFFTIVAFLFLILWGLKAFLTPFIEETRKFVQNFDQHRQRVEGAIRDIQLSYQQWYESLPPNSQRWLSQQQRALQEATTGFWNHLDGWVQQLGKQTGVWLTFLVELLILPVIVFYLVLDASPSQRRLRKELFALVPRRYLRLAIKIAQETNTVMRAYILGQLILCVIAGITMGLGLRLFGIPYAFTLALFAGAARAIPVIGAAVAGVPILLIVLISTDLSTAIQVAIFITVLFFVEHKMIMPKIIGDRVAMHPVLVIVVLLISGKFFGLMGMFFGVPVVVIARNVGRWLYAPREPIRLTAPVAVSKSATGTEGFS